MNYKWIKFFLFLPFILLSGGSAAENYLGLSQETPEHANEVIGTNTYVNQSLNEFFNDYPEIKKRIIKQLKKKFSNLNNLLEPEITNYTITYFSALPSETMPIDQENCIMFPILVTGYRHITPFFLCILPKENSLGDFLHAYPALKQNVLQAILSTQGLTNTPTNQPSPVLSQQISYVGVDPPPVIPAHSNCYTIKLPVSVIKNGKFYICVE